MAQRSRQEGPRARSRPAPGSRLALLGCVLALAVVALGAFTRLVDAGLGCPDWPGCYGHLLWPRADHEVMQANASFPDMPVDHDKTWPEMIHRYLAGGLGLLVAALALVAWRHRRRRGQPFRLPLLLLALVVAQALLGMWTVTLRLWPQVVVAHLLGGLLTLTLLALLTQRLFHLRWRLTLPELGRLHSLRPWLWLALLMTLVQIALGGWTTANYAAVACPDLPTCQGRWLPAMDLAQGFDLFHRPGPSHLGGRLDNEARVAIHYSHRLGALLTLIAVGTLCALLWWRAGFAAARRMAALLGTLLLVQLALGLANVLLHFPVWVAVAHNLGAALLLVTLASLAHRVHTATPHSEGG